MATAMVYKHQSLDDLISLICAIREGDHQAFSMLVERFQGMGFVVAFNMLGNKELAEDALQEAFLAAYRELHKLREPAAFPSWFRRLVVKYSDRLIRKKSIQTEPLGETTVINEHINDPAKMFEQMEGHYTLQTALNNLPSSQRIPLKLFYYQGYSQKDIAAFLGLPLSTVKKRLFDARHNIKEILEMPKQQDLSNEVATRINFFIALKSRNMDQIRKLVEQDAALIDAQTQWGEASEGYYWPTGMNAMMWAAATGDRELMEFLMDRGGDVHCLNEEGMSRTLWSAINMQQIEMVKVLLEYGVGTQGQHYSDHGLLHLAVIVGNAEIVALLLEHGADIGIVDKNGRTAGDWAAIKGDEAVINVLVEVGMIDITAEISRLPEMTAISREIGVSPLLLSNMLNVKGEIVDGLEGISVQDYRPIYRRKAPYILTTGIKIVDAIAPLKRGGHNGIFTPLPGLGKLVLLGQIVENMRQLYDGVTVSLMVEDGPYTAENLMLCWRSMGVQDRVVQVAVGANGGVQDTLRGAETALTLADYFREQGHEVLLLVDSRLALEGEVVDYLRLNPSVTPSSAVTIVYYGDHTPETDPEIFGSLDTLITFDRRRAKAGLWPAIDPLRSKAFFFDYARVDDQHVNLVNQAKRILQRYQDLGVNGEVDVLANDVDREIAMRARRLNQFLTQPFTLAESFTARLGEIVSLKDTLAGIEAILVADLDDVSEDQLSMIGALALE